MKYNCLKILKMTEAQLKFTYDVSLGEASAQELHEALGKAVMMAISDNWNRLTIFLLSISSVGWCIPTFTTWAFWMR